MLIGHHRQRLPPLEELPQRDAHGSQFGDEPDLALEVVQRLAAVAILGTGSQDVLLQDVADDVLLAAPEQRYPAVGFGLPFPQ